MNTSTLPLALVCSVALEAAPALAGLAAAEERRIGGKPAHYGRVGEQPVVVLVAGMGKTNAAHALTALRERHPLLGVLGFGVGGAYPGSGFTVGDLALASEEIYGDEGVETPSEWLSTEQIGIPLLHRAGTERFNRFPLDPRRVAAAERILAEAGIPTRSGPFVTVSNCSGTARRGAELARRFGGVCETMEGAALAHVAALYDLPFLELRGISNQVEDRDLAAWDLRAAAEAAARSVLIVARSWPT